MGALTYTAFLSKEASIRAGDVVDFASVTCNHTEGALGDYVAKEIKGAALTRSNTNGSSSTSLWRLQIDAMINGSWHTLGYFDEGKVESLQTLSGFVVTASANTLKQMGKMAPTAMRATVLNGYYYLSSSTQLTINIITILDNLKSGITFTQLEVPAGNTQRVRFDTAAAGNRHEVTFKLNDTYSQKVSVAAGLSYVDFTLPLSWCKGLPNTESGLVSVTVETFAGDRNLGTSQDSFRMLVPSNMVPQDVQFSAQMVDGYNNMYVKNKSKVQFAASASGDTGSTIVAYRIEGAGFVGNTAGYKTGVLTQSGVLEFTLTVTDSRGRTAKKILQITVEDYSQPKITAGYVYRCDAAGNETDSGRYIYFRAYFLFKDFDGKNKLTAKAKYRLQGENWQNETVITAGQVLVLGANAVDEAKVYEAAIDLTDDFGTVTVPYLIPTQSVDFDFTSEGAAFGQRATRNQALELAPGWSYFGRALFAKAHAKNVWYQCLTFRDSDDKDLAYVVIDHQDNTSSPSFGLRIFSRQSNGEMTSNAEVYSLPKPDVGRTSSIWYEILTTKKPVTIAQGGHGATTAAQARTNLGIAVEKIVDENISASKTYTMPGAGKYLVMVNGGIGGNLTGMAGFLTTNSTAKIETLYKESDVSLNSTSVVRQLTIALTSSGTVRGVTILRLSER